MPAGLESTDNGVNAPCIVVLRDTVEASARDVLCRMCRIVSYTSRFTINNSLDLSWRRLFVSSTYLGAIYSLKVGIEASGYYKLLFHSDNFFNLLNQIFASFFKFSTSLNPICTYYFRIKNTHYGLKIRELSDDSSNGKP